MLQLVGATLILLVLALTLGHWRVRLRKASYERPIRAQWDRLDPQAKRRLLASTDFAAGLRAERAAFPRTARALARGADADQVFAAYLGELRASDADATSDEWRDTLSRLTAWMA